MSQLSLETGTSNPITQIYQLVNSEKFLNDVAQLKKGNKSAGRRVRKYLLEIKKLALEGRVLILDSS